MFIHFIALVNLNDKDVAYHFSSQDSMEVKIKQKEFNEKISVLPKSVKSIYSTHILPTEAENFDSVKLDDPYFEPFEEEKSLDKFIDFILSNIQLTAFDIATYLLRKDATLNEFSLQKLLYYIYSDYLVEYKKSLFKNRFVAFNYGPVDQNVYSTYRYNIDKLLSNVDFEVKLNAQDDVKGLLNFIDAELAKYGDYFTKLWDNHKANDSEENLTHHKNTPWFIAYSKGQNTRISDDLIKKFHKNELLV